MTILYAATETISGQCGIGTIKYVTNAPKVVEYDGSQYFEHSNGSSLFPLEQKEHAGGCALVGTGFIDEEISRESYMQMCKIYRLVFQTPVRKNTNSGNMFFYAMFDELNNTDEVGYLPTLPTVWPFKESE